MLTPEERARVRAEEIYREEVRRELQPPLKRGQRLWKLLNSSFTLWLFSTVVVGAIGFAWSQMEAAGEARRLRTEAVRNLNAEIGFRLRRLADDLDRFGAGQVDFSTVSRRVSEAPASFPKTLSGLKPDLAASSLLALAWELEHLESGDAAKSVSSARKCLREIQEARLEPIGPTETPEAYLQRRMEFKRSIEESLRNCVWLGRWGGAG